MSHRSLRACSAAAVFLLGVSSQVQAEPPRYRAIELEKSSDGAWPIAINNRGWVGGKMFSPPGTFGSAAVVFADGREHALVPLDPEVSALVLDLNDRGDAVGYLGYYLEGFEWHQTAYALIDGLLIELPAASFDWATPNAINNRREIVGYGHRVSDGFYTALGWRMTPTGPVDLPIHDQLAGAFDINEAGDIAGGGMLWCTRALNLRSWIGWNVYWGAVQHNGTLLRLTQPDCDHYAPIGAINDRGQALQEDGSTQSSDFDGTTWLWSADGSRVNLGIPGFRTSALDINEAGVLTGYRSDDSDSDGLVWNDNVPAILNDITLDAAEFDIRSGRDINDVNQIAALVRRYDSFDIYHALLLTPIDLTLAAPLPGIAGTRNSIYLAGATESEEILFFYSASPGTTALPGCDNLFLDLADPILIGRDEASPTTNAWLESDIPASARGRTLYLQAFEPSSCRISNRVEVTLR